MRSIEAHVDWNRVKESLAVLHRESSAFLSRSVLIGGAACWFYRVELASAADADFVEQTGDETEQKSWLSKDIDFTGVFRADAWEMLPSLVMRDEGGGRFLEAAGVRLGFAQVGLTFDPEEALHKARVAEFGSNGQTVQFLVMDPVTLYREKQALCQKRNEPHDRLHLAVLKEFLALELVLMCERFVREGNIASVADQQDATSLFLEINRGAVEIILDPRVRRRIEPLLAANNDQSRLVKDLVFGQ